MRLSVRMKKVEEKVNTTKLEPCREPAPMDSYYINTEFLTSLPFGTEELILHLSDEPLPEGEVAIAFPSLPFTRSTKNLTRFEIQNDRGRRLRSSLENPVTQAFVYNDELGLEVPTYPSPTVWALTAFAIYLPIVCMASVFRSLVTDVRTAPAKALNSVAFASLSLARYSAGFGRAFLWVAPSLVTSLQWAYSLRHLALQSKWHSSTNPQLE